MTENPRDGATSDEGSAGGIRDGPNRGGHVATGIDQGRDRDPRGREIRHRAGRVVVVREHDRATARRNAEAVEIAAHGAGQHDARAVVCRRTRAAVRSRLRPAHGASPRCARAAGGAWKAGGEARWSDTRSTAPYSPSNTPNTLVRSRMRQSGAARSSASAAATQVERRSAVDRPPLREQATAEAGVLFAEDHARAAAHGGQRGHQPGRAGPDHQDVAMQRRLVVMVGVVQAGGPAEARRRGGSAARKASPRKPPAT